MKKIILLNGPKESGKDTLGEHLVKHIPNSQLFMFKGPLYSWAADMACVDEQEFRAIANDRILKELPWNKLPINPYTGEHFSPRGWLIYVSENVLKPRMGDRIFGDALAREVSSSGVEVAIITDSGFEKEAESLYTRLVANMLVIRIHRPGYTFEGDSRNYINPPFARILDLQNDKTLGMFLDSGLLMANIWSSMVE